MTNLTLPPRTLLTALLAVQATIDQHGATDELTVARAQLSTLSVHGTPLGRIARSKDPYAQLVAVKFAAAHDTTRG